MSKYKAIYKPQCGNDKGMEVLGVFTNKEDAAKACFRKARENGDLYDCDPWEDVLYALMNRDFYMVGYGPREICIEEVAD